MKKKFKTMSKRTIAVVLTLVMLLTAVPIVGLTAFAAETLVSGDFEYEVLEDGTARLTKYLGNETDITIPGEIDGYKVTVIGSQIFGWCDPEPIRTTIPDGVTTIEEYAFEYCFDLTEIIIPNSVNYIAKGAFSDCHSLTEMKIPNGITKIEDDTFYYCTALKKVTIPESVTAIGNTAFANCYNLEDVSIPYSVTSIGNGAFASCNSLTDINIPRNVEFIGNAFSGCENLNSITVDSANDKYSSINGVLFNKDQTELIYYTDGAGQYYNIPNTVNKINAAAFANRKVIEVSIPFGVSEISGGVFSECYQLENVIIPDSITSIGVSAFFYCENLKEIKIPKSVEAIGVGSFGCSGLTDIYYDGTEEEWNQIPKEYDTSYGPDPLETATIHFTEESEHTHSYTEAVTKEATCKEEGVKTFTCSCGDSYTEAIPATGHQNLKEIVVPATCKVQGMKYTICTDCGDPIGESETLPVIPHDCREEVTKEATCTENGVKSLICNMCNETISTEEIPATGHSFGEWVVTKEPTEAEKGMKESTCADCGEKKTEEIPCLPQTVKDEQSGITVDAPSGSYDGKLEMNVEEQFDGESFQIINGMDGVSQSKVYDITTTVDGEKVQPGVPVTVRIPLPEGYDPERTFVYHINSETGEVENMNARVENGYLVFETDHFSIYAVVEEAEPEKDYGIIGNIIKVVIDLVVKVVKIVFEFIKDLFCAIF